MGGGTAYWLGPKLLRFGFAVSFAPANCGGLQLHTVEDTRLIPRRIECVMSGCAKHALD